MSSKEILIKKSSLTPTVLIAGGSGFLGIHLAEKLLLQDVRVVLVDTLQASVVGNLPKNPRFVFFDANINEAIPEKIKSADYVIQIIADADSSPTNAFGTKNLLDLTKKSDAKFLLVSPLNSNDETVRFAEALVQEYYKNQNMNVRIVRLPGVYGPRMSLEESGNLGRLLGESLKHKDLTIFGDGTEKEYYLYKTDAVSGLVKALFNSGTEGEVFSLVPEKPSAVLEIAYLVKGLADADLRVRSRNEKSRQETFIPPDTKNLRHLKWEPRVGLKEGLIKSMLWFGHTPNEHGFKPAKLIENKKREKAVVRSEQIMSLVDEVKQSIESISAPQPVKKLGKRRLKFPRLKIPRQDVILAILVAAVVFIGMPFVQVLAYSAIGAKNLQKTSDALLSLDSETAKTYSNKAFKNFVRVESALGRTKWVWKSNSYGSLITSAKYFSKATYDSTKAVKPFSTLFDAIKPNSTTPIDSNGFKNSELLLAGAKSNFSRAYGEFKNVDKNELPAVLDRKVDMYEKALKAAVSYVDTAAILSSQVPELLGVGDAPKTYLVLFQNSNEIRPTGGFIGSYALVETQNGKISSITIDDIYNPDGQIDARNIKVAPPAVLAEALKEDRLYIRNANWNPDFNKSAETIRDLYFRVTGKNVDGILAVDLGFVQEMLDVTGPVYLTAFGEEISSANLYERTQFHSEFNFEEGSDQKKQFLTLLGSKVLEGIFAIPKEKTSELMTTLGRLLAEKHLLVSLPGNPLSVELGKHGWDGSLTKVNGDYLYVVNANIGGTKANYFVKNEMKYQVSSQTRDGILRAALTLNYKHTGTDSAWPGGPYKDYVRVLTQDGSKLTNATVGKAGEPGTNIFEKMAVGREGDYTSFEYLIELNPQEELTLTLYYDLPTNLSLTAANKIYYLYWQKQPGTEADPITFIFEPPFGTEVEQQTQVQTNLSTDKVFSISLR